MEDSVVRLSVNNNHRLVLNDYVFTVESNVSNRTSRREQDRRKRYFCYIEIPRVPKGQITRPSVFNCPILTLRCILKIAKDEEYGQPVFNKKCKVPLYPPVINYAIIHKPFIPAVKRDICDPLMKLVTHEGHPVRYSGDIYKANQPVCQPFTYYSPNHSCSPNAQFSFSPNSPAVSPNYSPYCTSPVKMKGNTDNIESIYRSCMRPPMTEETRYLDQDYEDVVSPLPSADTHYSKWKQPALSPTDLYSGYSPMTTPETISQAYNPFSPDPYSFPIDESSITNKITTSNKLKINVKKRSLSNSDRIKKERKTKPIRNKIYYVYCEIPKIKIGDHRRNSIVRTNKILLHCMLQLPNPGTNLQFPSLPLLQYVRPKVNFAVIHRTMLIDAKEYARSRQKSKSKVQVQKNRVSFSASPDQVREFHQNGWVKRPAEDVSPHSGDDQSISMFKTNLGFDYTNNYNLQESKYALIPDWKLASSNHGNMSELTLRKERKPNHHYFKGTYRK